MNILPERDLISEGLRARISETARFLGVTGRLFTGLSTVTHLPTVRIGRSRRVPIRAVRELAATNLVCESSPLR